MVNLSNYLRRSNVDVSGPLPLLNSLFIDNTGIFGNTQEKPNFHLFMERVKKSPHLAGFLRIIVSDIISDDIHFENLDVLESGRNRLLKAKKFWMDNNGREVLEETITDMLTLGIGYNWFAQISEQDIKEVCRKIATKLYEEKEIEFKAEQIFSGLAQKDPAIFIKKFRHIPASTVSINHSETAITGYIQRVGVHEKFFSPNEVIPYKLMPFDGGVYPYAPMEALLAEVYLLWLITQVNVSFFENGGSPDKVFILPKEIAGSKNHAYLIEQLKKYKKVQNKHGNLVFTGDLSVQDLMKVENQMEHRELSLYLVGVLALFYSVPSGRIPFLIGKSSNNGDAGGLADSGYWRMISVLQSKIEDALNQAIFNKFFGVNIVFSRGYKQDEVRETQIEMQKVQIAEQLINLGLWTEEYAGNYLNIPEEIVLRAIKKKAERQQEIASGMLNQNLNTNKNVEFEPDKLKKNQKKSNTQRANFRDNPDKEPM